MAPRPLRSEMRFRPSICDPLDAMTGLTGPATLSARREGATLTRLISLTGSRLRSTDCFRSTRNFRRLSGVMSFFCGQSSGRLLIVHGGAHTSPPDPAKLRLAVESLVPISQSCDDVLSRGCVCDAVVAALEAMEADPIFNAGLEGRCSPTAKSAFRPD